MPKVKKANGVLPTLVCSLSLLVFILHLQTYCKKHSVLAQPTQIFCGLWDSLAAIYEQSREDLSSHDQAPAKDLWHVSL
jgi:hypothetical protein